MLNLGRAGMYKSTVRTSTHAIDSKRQKNGCIKEMKHRDMRDPVAKTDFRMSGLTRYGRNRIANFQAVGTALKIVDIKVKGQSYNNEQVGK